MRPASRLLASVLAAIVCLPVTADTREETIAPLRAVPAGARPGKAARMCGVCHSDIRVKYENGIHRSEGIDCVSCHGGDPNAITVERAHRGGYRGVPSRRSIPSLCASCHGDVERMRFYDLPSDQYALYQTSRHGLVLAKGDVRAAVCTDCHGVHEIRAADDPKSTIFGRNIPTTCGTCHSQEALRERYRHKNDPVADYNDGVHGRAFLVEANDASPECTRCHGSHGATPPGVGDVDKVCGQCHAKTRTYFLAGPHKEGMDAAGELECAGCHHNHRTQNATPEDFDKICLDCHDKGDDELRIASAFKRMIEEAKEEIARADKFVAMAAAIPLYVEDYRSRLEDARTALLESAPVTHSLDSTRMEPHTRRARSIAARVSEEIDEKIAARWWHKVGLGLFWFYLLLTATIITRARRRAAAERDR